MNETLFQIKKLAKLRALVKMFSKEIENIEEDMMISLEKDPVPNVTIKVTDGQVRPKWKEEFIALATKCGFNSDTLVKDIQNNTERGKSSKSIVIGNQYEPSVEELIPILDKV